GTASSSGSRLVPELAEETSDVPPHLRPAGKTLPSASNNADEAVALIRRGQEILRWGESSGIPHAIDQQRLHVRLHSGEHGISCLELFPGLEREQGLGGAGRTRVAGDHLGLGAAIEEEGEIDREPEV